MGRLAIYKTEEERKKAERERRKRWAEKNPEHNRAAKLRDTYIRADRKANRGECTLTAEWIMKHIFSKPCAHCGKIGWDVIGCNRLDNSLPHTPDNVEPCCYDCNLKVEGKEQKQVYQYTLDGELVKVWESTKECGRNGFHRPNVIECCKGNRKTSDGFIWRYAPLIQNIN